MLYLKYTSKFGFSYAPHCHCVRLYFPRPSRPRPWISCSLESMLGEGLSRGRERGDQRQERNSAIKSVPLCWTIGRLLTTIWPAYLIHIAFVANLDSLKKPRSCFLPLPFPPLTYQFCSHFILSFLVFLYFVLPYLLSLWKYTLYSNSQRQHRLRSFYLTSPLPLKIKLINWTHFGGGTWLGASSNARDSILNKESRARNTWIITICSSTLAWRLMLSLEGNVRVQVD